MKNNFKIGDIIRNKKPYLFEPALKIVRKEYYSFSCIPAHENEKTTLGEIINKYEIDNYKKVYFPKFICLIMYYLRELKFKLQEQK